MGTAMQKADQLVGSAGGHSASPMLQHRIGCPMTWLVSKSGYSATSTPPTIRLTMRPEPSAPGPERRRVTGRRHVVDQRASNTWFGNR